MCIHGWGFNWLGGVIVKCAIHLHGIYTWRLFPRPRSFQSRARRVIGQHRVSLGKKNPQEATWILSISCQAKSCKVMKRGKTRLGINNCSFNKGNDPALRKWANQFLKIPPSHPQPPFQRNKNGLIGLYI